MSTKKEKKEFRPRKGFVIRSMSFVEEHTRKVTAKVLTESGWSGVKIKKALDISEPMVSLLKNGQATPSHAIIFLLCEVFGREISEFYPAKGMLVMKEEESEVIITLSGVRI